MATQQQPLQRATRQTHLEEFIMRSSSLTLVAGLITAFASTATLAADDYTLNQNLPTAIVAKTPFVASRVAAVDEFQRNQYPAAAVPSGLQRAQVVAEAIEARKLGLVTEGERQAPAPTAAQAEKIRLAGVNAVNSQFAAK
jgi:hypothetical protein